MDSAEVMSGPYAKALAAGGLGLLAETLAKEVDAWLSERGMSGSDEGGVSYQTWLGYFDRPMRGAVALVICTETLSVGEELDGVGEWEDFLWDIGFSCEMLDPTVMVLYPAEDDLRRLIHETFAFEWYSRLVAPDYAAIYSSIYSYFAQNPEGMAHSARGHGKSFSRRSLPGRDTRPYSAPAGRMEESILGSPGIRYTGTKSQLCRRRERRGR